MEAGEEGVIIRESTWQRLWEKSAIGCPVTDGLSLAAEEVIFCHEQRQFEWPTSDWLATAVAGDEALLHRGEILVALRAPGNLVVLRQHAADIPTKHQLSNDSWALRWHREKHPSRDEPNAEIRWARSDEKIDWNGMQVWSEEVKSRGRIAEFLVIDDEFSVVTYRVEPARPSGDSQNPKTLSASQINHIKSKLKMAKKVPSGGWLLPSTNDGKNGTSEDGNDPGKEPRIDPEIDPEIDSADKTENDGNVSIITGAENQAGKIDGIADENQGWPLPQIGIELHGGRLLSDEEIQAVCILTGIAAEINSNSKSGKGRRNNQDSIEILQDLFARGCSVRSGFKYGTKWRVYAGAVGNGHAPWLILPLHAAPTDWAGACLAARLAAGVNKTWCVALPTETNENASQQSAEYLAVRRPPSDSRWSNPHRR